MAEQSVLDFTGHLIKIQRFFQYPTAPGEMTAHDRMVCVHAAERASLIFYFGAKKFGGQLILELFNSLPVRVAKEKADHTIRKNTIDESIDDVAQSAFAAKTLK